MYDVVIIGSGPGGYACAIRAAQLGLNAVIVEKGKIGGVCANVGCIPTKALVSSAEVARKMKSAATFGVKITGFETDFAVALKRARLCATISTKGVEMLLKENKVEVIQGEAVVEKRGAVVVGERKLETKNIVLATGGSAISIPGVSFNDKIICGEELVHLQELPKRVVIVGGGVEGVEYAAVLNAFGSQVTIIEMLDRLVAFADKDASELVTKSLAGAGVRVLCSTRAEKIEPGAVHANGERIEADKIIVAIGKRPNISQDLQKLGLKATKKGIEVDAQMRTSIPGIYAIGDVAGGGLAHVASEQGVVAAESIAGKKATYDSSAVPACIFTTPEVSWVGDVSGKDATIGHFQFAALGRATASGERIGFVKVFVKEGIIAGCVIAGPHASDLIAEATLAVRLKLKAEDVGRTIHAHPTFPEAFQEAVKAALGETVHSSKHF